MSEDGEYGIVANVAEVDRVFRLGSKAWLAGGTGGQGWDCFAWIGRTRSGRQIHEPKWTPTHRFTNFRAAWIPPHLRSRIGSLPWVNNRGSREEVAAAAARLNKHADEMRAAHPNRGDGRWRPRPEGG
jgi:hypothetical protein